MTTALQNSRKEVEAVVGLGVIVAVEEAVGGVEGEAGVVVEEVAQVMVEEGEVLVGEAVAEVVHPVVDMPERMLNHNDHRAAQMATVTDHLRIVNSATRGKGNPAIIKTTLTPSVNDPSLLEAVKSTWTRMKMRKWPMRRSSRTTMMRMCRWVTKRRLQLKLMEKEEERINRNNLECLKLKNWHYMPLNHIVHPYFPLTHSCKIVSCHCGR